MFEWYAKLIVAFDVVSSMLNMLRRKKVKVVCIIVGVCFDNELMNTIALGFSDVQFSTVDIFVGRFSESRVGTKVHWPFDFFSR